MKSSYSSTHTSSWPYSYFQQKQYCFFIQDPVTTSSNLLQPLPEDERIPSSEDDIRSRVLAQNFDHVTASIRRLSQLFRFAPQDFIIGSQGKQVTIFIPDHVPFDLQTMAARARETL